MTEKPPSDPDLTREVAALRTELERLNSHRFITIQNNPLRLLGFRFAAGVATGFGTVVGATILVSIAAYLLAQIDFVPIIGEWAMRIADEIQQPEAE